MFYVKIRVVLFVLIRLGLSFLTWVGFEGLGLEKIFLPEYAFKFFGLEVNFYAIIFSTAIVVGLFFSWRFAEKFGVLKSQILDVVFFGLIFGIFGARLYYVVFNFSEYFNNESIWLNLLELIDLRAGGVALYGGLIFSCSAVALVCRLKKIKIFPMADLLGVCFPIGQAVGRWGNFFNVEAYGSKTNLPWGMVSNKIPSQLQPVHPTFLYESIWCFLVFLFLVLFIKHRKFDGEIFGFYLALYSLERFFVEGLRTDSLMLFQTNIRVSQFLSLVLFIASVSVLIFFSLKFKKRPMVLFSETEEFKQMLKTQTS